MGERERGWRDLKLADEAKHRELTRGMLFESTWKEVDGEIWLVSWSAGSRYWLDRSHVHAHMHLQDCSIVWSMTHTSFILRSIYVCFLEGSSRCGLHKTTLVGVYYADPNYQSQLESIWVCACCAYHRFEGNQLGHFKGHLMTQWVSIIHRLDMWLVIETLSSFSKLGNDREQGCSGWNSPSVN